MYAGLVISKLNRLRTLTSANIIRSLGVDKMLLPSRSYCQDSQPTKAPLGENALEVAMIVNKIKKSHQATSASNDKKNMELAAWEKLNGLTEEKIMGAEGKAVALLLNSWAYFSKYWEKGKDGPADTPSNPSSNAVGQINT